MNEETVDDLDLRRKRQCIHCGIWYPVEYVEAQSEEGWDIDLNRPFYACKRCLGRLVGLSNRWKAGIQTYIQKPRTVEAVQLTYDNVYDVAEWCNGTLRGFNLLEVKTRNSSYHLCITGDYIVKDEDGIFERFSEKQFLRLMTLNDSM